MTALEPTLTGIFDALLIHHQCILAKPYLNSLIVNLVQSFTGRHHINRQINLTAPKIGFEINDMTKACKNIKVELRKAVRHELHPGQIGHKQHLLRTTYVI